MSNLLSKFLAVKPESAIKYKIRFIGTMHLADLITFPPHGFTNKQVYIFIHCLTTVCYQTEKKRHSILSANINKTPKLTHNLYMKKIHMARKHNIDAGYSLKRASKLHLLREDVNIATEPHKNDIYSKHKS